MAALSFLKIKNPVRNISLVAFPLILASSSISSAYADDWGCQVLLCLSNPGGPTQFSECVPPITKLYKQLAQGKPFPTCTMSGGTGSSNVASNPVYGVQQYEDCPSGYQPEFFNFGAKQKGTCYRDVELSELGGSAYSLKQGESYVLNGAVVSNPNHGDLALPGVMVRQRINAALRSQPNYIEYTLNGETKRLWW